MRKKFLTHNERCASHELHLCDKSKFTPVTINSRVAVVDAEGRVTYKSEKIILDNREKFKHLRVTDFGMSNLIAVGADKNLSLVSMLPDKFTSISEMEKAISHMENSFSPSPALSENPSNIINE